MFLFKNFKQYQVFVGFWKHKVLSTKANAIEK